MGKRDTGRGVGYTKHLDETLRAGVYETHIPNIDFLYETPTTTQNPDYAVGDRVCLPDGRVFRYGRCANICRNTMQGLKFYGQEGDGVAYKAPSQTQAIGDESITMDAGDEGDVDLDELRGGYIIVHTHTDYADFTRGIVGNTAADSDGYVTVYLDAPLHIAIKTTYGLETCPNPYKFLSYRSSATGSGPGGDAYSSVAGIPLRKTTAANQFVWIQTWGPCWINPQGAVGYTPATDRREMKFTREGSIQKNDANAQTTSSMQTAGFLMTAEDASATSPPLMYLQISP